jgi:hypothetical protein
MRFMQNAKGILKSCVNGDWRIWCSNERGILKHVRWDRNIRCHESPKGMPDVSNLLSIPLQSSPVKNCQMEYLSHDFCVKRDVIF